jgi:hypothetical protein
MSKPFAFAAAETPLVRGYSIGPHHVDWLCVKCGAVEALEEIGPFALAFRVQCAAEAAKHVKPLDLDPPRLVEMGALALRLQSERSLFAHLQGHVRFEQVERTE